MPKLHVGYATFGRLQAVSILDECLKLGKPKLQLQHEAKSSTMVPAAWPVALSTKKAHMKPKLILVTSVA